MRELFDLQDDLEEWEQFINNLLERKTDLDLEKIIFGELTLQKLIELVGKLLIRQNQLIDKLQHNKDKRKYREIVNRIQGTLAEIKKETSDE